jgi:hypothetical protein
VLTGGERSVKYSSYSIYESVREMGEETTTIQVTVILRNRLGELRRGGTTPESLEDVIWRIGKRELGDKPKELIAK